MPARHAANTLAGMLIESGTRALVTGASRGIGRALAAALAQREATIGLVARTPEALEQLAVELPGTHQVLVCDVAKRAAVEASVQQFVNTAGGLDLVVVNAGIAHYEPLATQSVERIEQMTQVNWLGTVYTIKAALPHLLDSGRGHIVVMSSGAGLRPFPSAAAYSATKAAQRMLAEALRHELSGTGVSLTTVFPGEIATSLHDHQTTMPPWYRGGEQAATAQGLAERVVKGIEDDERHVHYRRSVRSLEILNGISPRMADAMLRRLRGRSAAPRRD